MVMLLLRSTVLFKAAEGSVFAFDQAWLAATIAKPAGLLTVAGELLTRLFVVPWVGATVLVAVLIALQRTIWIAANRNNKTFALSMIPSAVLLGLACRIGYEVFVLNDHGVMFSEALGLLSAMSLSAVWRYVGSKGWRYAFVVLVSTVGFHLLGLYALVALAAIVLTELRNREWGVAATALIAGGAVPKILQTAFYDNLNPKLLYLSGTPVLDFAGNPLFGVLIGIAVAVALLTIGFAPKGKGESKGEVWLDAAAVLVSVSTVICGSMDRSLRCQLRMERAIDNFEWQKASDQAEKCGITTRAIAMYRNIALMQQGRLGREQFAVPDQSDTLRTRAKISITDMCGARVFYNFGLVNFARRWTMEQAVQHGFSVERLKFLALTAMWNDERELSLKYLDRLDMMPFTRRWTERQRRLLENNVWKQRPPFNIIAELQQFDGKGWLMCDVVEQTVLRHFCSLRGGSEQIEELALASMLVIKSAQPFMQGFTEWIEGRKASEVPELYVEAALAFAGSTKNSAYFAHVVDTFKDDFAPTVERYNTFIAAAKAAGNNPSEQSKENMKRRFGNSYLYYYFYFDNLKMN